MILLPVELMLFSPKRMRIEATYAHWGVFNYSDSLRFGNTDKFSSVADLLAFCDKVLSVRLNT